MDTMIDRLQQQADGLDATGLDPDRALPGVVRRGKRYLVVVSTASILGVTAAVAAAAVAVPQVVQQMQGPSQPTVLSTPADGDVKVEQGPIDKPSAVPSVAPTVKPSVAPTPDETVEHPPKGTPAPPPADVTAPELVVLEPADGATVTSAKVTFSGTTEPGARVKAGGYEATVDDDGRWSILLIASQGPNTVTFTAADTAGNTTDATVTVTYKPQTTKDTSPDKPAQDEPADSTLTASQQSSVLDAAPHKNSYSGTAAPGAKVAVTSQYGSGYAWADDAGRWKVLVDFDPPGGTTTFPVTVKLHHQPDVTRSFQLTTVADQKAAFTASQKSATVPASNPTNVYSGTGQPGHEVLIWTEQHGQTTTVIGADGTWQVSLTYTDVAAGDTFHVKALDQSSNTKHMFEVTIT